ncbi:hypothetical protein, partial [Nocardia aurea]
GSVSESVEASRGEAAKRFQSRLDTRYRRGAPLRRDFLHTGVLDSRSAIATLMSSSSGSGGGRGGHLRLAMLVSIIWVAAAPPHNATRPARWWAGLAGLPDPTVGGARRVLNAMHELHDRGYLIMERAKNGRSPTVHLLNETGDRTPYQLPYADPQPNYVRIPHQLWTTELISRLSGRGLALYLCVLSHHNADDPGDGIWFTRQGFRDLHGLGESTRLKGLTELIDANVISSQERSIDAVGGSDFRTYRRRLFTIEPPYAPPPPGQNPRQQGTQSAPLIADPWGAIRARERNRQGPQAF